MKSLWIYVAFQKWRSFIFATSAPSFDKNNNHKTHKVFRSTIIFQTEIRTKDVTCFACSILNCTLFIKYKVLPSFVEKYSTHVTLSLLHHHLIFDGRHDVRSIHVKFRWSIVFFMRDSASCYRKVEDEHAGRVDRALIRAFIEYHRPGIVLSSCVFAVVIFQRFSFSMIDRYSPVWRPLSNIRWSQIVFKWDLVCSKR